MSDLQIHRYTKAKECLTVALEPDEAWKMRLSFEAGEVTLEELAAEVLRMMLTMESDDLDQVDGDRTESVEITYVPKSGDPQMATWDSLGEYECDDDERECDSCGVITDAGAWPDWVNGSCESCDPDILNQN